MESEITHWSHKPSQGRLLAAKIKQTKVNSIWHPQWLNLMPLLLKSILWLVFNSNEFELSQVAPWCHFVWNLWHIVTLHHYRIQIVHTFCMIHPHWGREFSPLIREYDIDFFLYSFYWVSTRTILIYIIKRN